VFRAEGVRKSGSPLQPLPPPCQGSCGAHVAGGTGSPGRRRRLAEGVSRPVRRRVDEGPLLCEEGARDVTTAVAHPLRESTPRSSQSLAGKARSPQPPAVPTRFRPSSSLWQSGSGGGGGGDGEGGGGGKASSGGKGRSSGGTQKPHVKSHEPGRAPWGRFREGSRGGARGRGGQSRAVSGAISARARTSRAEEGLALRAVDRAVALARRLAAWDHQRDRRVMQGVPCRSLRGRGRGASLPGRAGEALGGCGSRAARGVDHIAPVVPLGAVVVAAPDRVQGGEGAARDAVRGTRARRRGRGGHRARRRRGLAAALWRVRLARPHVPTGVSSASLGCLSAVSRPSLGRLSRSTCLLCQSISVKSVESVPRTVPPSKVNSTESGSVGERTP